MLGKLSLQNFCCFEDVELPLDKQGLVWIGGENNDTEAAKSNGSGKTTLFKGLSWVLYGESVDGDKGDRVIRYGAKSAVGEVELGEWLVRRIRNKGQPKLELLAGGKPLKESKQILQQRINHAMGLDFTAFKNTILYGQNDVARFADPRTKDSDRKDMLQRIQRATVLQSCYTKALDRRSDVKRQLDALATQKAGWKDKFQSASARIDRIRIQMAEWEEQRESDAADQLVAAKAHREQAQAVLSTAPDVDALTAERSALSEAIVEAERAGEMAEKWEGALEAERKRFQAEQRKVDKLKSNLEHVNKILQRLDADHCPTCQGRLDTGDSARYIQDTRDKRDTLVARIKDWDDSAAALKQSVKNLESRVLDSKSKFRMVSDLNRQLRLIDSRISDARKLKQRAKDYAEKAKHALESAKEIQSRSNPHRAHLKDAKGEMRLAASGVRTALAEMESLSGDLSRIEFWVRGFSNQGLPSVMLDSAMPYITDRANHYLDILSDGDISIDFNTQRELKSAKGEYRDEIEISWSIEGIVNHAPSGGQQKKIEIATDLALMDLAEGTEGISPDLFIADEILDGLDSEGTDRVLRLLHELRSRRGTIFVVSHRPSMAEVFEKSILVVKRDGVSQIRVAS